MNQVSLLALPHIDPGRGRIELEVPFGCSVADMVELALAGATDDQRANARVLIGGHVIEREVWARVRPLPGVTVVIRAVPGRGNMRTVLAIAVTVAAIATGQFYGATLGASIGLSGATASAVGSAIITTAITVGGTLLINALVPLRSNKGGRKESPTYSIEGWQNTANPDGVFPEVLGKHRLAPPFLARPYSEVVGDDQYIIALFGLYGRKAWSNLRFGETALYKPEAEWVNPLVPEFHFEDVQIETRDGILGDDLITLYPTQVLQEPLSIQLRTDEPHVRVSPSDVSELSVDLSFPGGIFRTDSASGDTLDYWADLRIRYRLVGAPSWTVEQASLRFSAEKLQAFFRTYRWAPPVRGRYEVELMRVGPEATGDGGDMNRMDWVVLRGHRPEYPLNFDKPLALVAIRVRASEQLNGTLDIFNADVETICPDWDSGSGTWITRATRNPASLYRYVLQGPSLAYPLTDDEIDIEGLQDWHDFCVEKGLKYDRVHDFDGSVYDTLADIAAAGRATPHDKGDQWGVMIDRPSERIVDHIGTRNSWGFEGSRNYARLAKAWRIKFPDALNGYNSAERLVPRPGEVRYATLAELNADLDHPNETRGEVFDDPTPANNMTYVKAGIVGAGGWSVESLDVTEAIELPGKVDAEEIWIEGKRRWWEILYRLDSWTINQDLEALIAERGDRVALSHDVLDRTMVSARVKSVAGAVVEIDEIVRMEAAGAYACRFRKIKTVGEVEADEPALSLLRTVQTVEGETSALILTGTGDVPEVGDLALFGPASQETFAAKVKGIERGESLTARLTLVPNAEEIDTLTDAEIAPAWDGRVGEIDPSPTVTAPATPTILDIRSSSEVESGDVLVMIGAGSGGGTVSSYDVEHRLQGAVSWSVVSTPAGTGAAEFGGYGGSDNIEARARAIGLTGLQSAYTSIATAEFGENDPGVSFFDATLIGTGTWRYEFEVEGPGVVGIHLRYRAGSYSNFADLTSEFTGILTVSPWDASLPDVLDTYTFGAVAVLADGTEVGDPVLIVRFDSLVVNGLMYDQPGNALHWLFLSTI